eukprot:CAMPEP_0115173864 /NCGR_PEP_ID=MMETSP0270-20121206/3544_1 /TAXON_ID=71861 /ORGANISM="Scrippsiella trochoidea, Strain CCMP3099" /LENGTH=63 /DNA_ID=CAMNT_0002586687 /DNA_START=100 /DNA_END=291 /DNA_ORIENTATION=-
MRSNRPLGGTGILCSAGNFPVLRQNFASLIFGGHFAAGAAAASATAAGPLPSSSASASAILRW